MAANQAPVKEAPGAFKVLDPFAASVADKPDSPPSAALLRDRGTLVGQQSVGTDAWSLYQLNGATYRIAEFPNTEKGTVYLYDAGRLPPLAPKPKLTGKVTKAELGLFGVTQITGGEMLQNTLAARVAWSWGNEERQARQVAILDLARSMEPYLSVEEAAHLHRFGWVQLTTDLGRRYQLEPRSNGKIGYAAVLGSVATEPLGALPPRLIPLLRTHERQFIDAANNWEIVEQTERVKRASMPARTLEL